MNQPSRSDFSHRLKSLRQARGMTQRDLAGKDLSVSYISLLESGQRQPTRETLRLLARALRCDVKDLVDGEPGHPEPAALLVRRAEVALESGQPGVAREQFERVLARTDLDAGARTQAMIGQAQALQREGRLAEAADVYERCVRAGMDDPSYGASITVAIGWCRCLYELGELVRAAEIGSRALAELDSVRAQDSDLALQLLATVAAVWYELGDLRQAQRLLDEGMERANRLGSAMARGAILWNASTVAHENGRYQEALELADQALAIFRSGSDRRAVSRLLIVNGYFLLRQAPPQPEKALGLLRKALDELSEDGSGVDRGYALTEISHAYRELGRTDEAVDAARRALTELGSGARLEQ
ncbi:MAG TPA: tetratricopeptide repeat protein, partial [Rugosimonospora sp.]|nr:tetratricopeptide repeat protein [Rugosimonospora sp.]